MTLTSNYQTCNKNAFWSHIFGIFLGMDDKHWTRHSAFKQSYLTNWKLKLSIIMIVSTAYPPAYFLSSLSLLIVKPVPSVSSQLTQNSPGRHAHWAEPIKDVHIWWELALLAVSQKVSITIFTNCESRFIIMYFLQYSDF